jgi:hypothetical protein
VGSASSPTTTSTALVTSSQQQQQPTNVVDPYRRRTGTQHGGNGNGGGGATAGSRFLSVGLGHLFHRQSRSASSHANGGGLPELDISVGALNVWMNDVVEFWFRHWKSDLADESGMSYVLERFLVPPQCYLLSFLTVELTLPGHVMRSDENITQCAQVATMHCDRNADYPITTNVLHGFIQPYAWACFMVHHPDIRNKPPESSGIQIYRPSTNEEKLPYCTLVSIPQVVVVDPTRGTTAHQIVRVEFRKTIFTLEHEPDWLEISKPTTPRSKKHFMETWEVFTRIVLMRVEMVLRAKALRAMAPAQFFYGS